jgi:tetratricopeptide (TPR) repeat protein
MMRYFCVILLCTVSAGLRAETLPDWFIPLREAVYEQRLKADEVSPLYREVQAAARARLSGADRDLMLSRCEYMMGRVLLFDGRKKEAGRYFTEGIRLAEQALKAGESAEGWRMLAENLSQNCAVQGTGYAMANGLDVEKYSKKALALNSRNAAAQYMIASRWVFAPPPLHNYKKGIEMMEDILTGGDMDKDDRFNVYSAIGYAYVQQKKYAEARPWLLKSLEIYPANKYAKDLLEAGNA